MLTNPQVAMICATYYNAQVVTTGYNPPDITKLFLELLEKLNEKSL